MSRKIDVSFDKLPVVKIRVIDKNDSAFETKSKKKYPFELENDIHVFVCEAEKNINFKFKIPKNYVWNGADIPKILFLFGQSKDNNYLVASMVHDFMLEKKVYIYSEVLKKSVSPSEYRKLTSLIFREILKDEKTNCIKANCMSWAVDIFQKTINFKSWKILEDC